MAALVSAWMGLACCVVGLAMLLWRGAFDDRLLPVVLWGACATIAVAGTMLFAFRKEPTGTEGIAAQRMQCKVGIGLALVAVVIVYALFYFAHEVPRPNPSARGGDVGADTGRVARVARDAIARGPHDAMLRFPCRKKGALL